MEKRRTITPLPRSTPEEQGIPSRALLALLDSFEGASFQLHSLMLLRHGQVIAEGWWRPYAPSNRRYLYSLSKSFTSTAVGFAVQAGLLDVTAKVTSFFQPDLPAVIDANLAAMRVKDLLTMTTGHEMDSTMMIVPRGLVNWAESILSMEVKFAPGTHFVYNSGATYLLSCIVQRVTGETVLDYLTPRLFEPLGIHGAAWDTCPLGVNVGGWGLSLGTEDLAKFGQFCLQKGSWNGRQLLSSAWVDEATSKQVSNDEDGREKEPSDWRQGYGYQFWRCQHNAYRGDGAFGQYCIVMPEQDAVLAITSETADMQAVLNRVWSCLLPAMGRDSLPPQPRDHELFQSRLAHLQVSLPAPCLPPAGFASFANRRFALKKNHARLQAVSLSFDDGGGCLHFWDNSREYQLPFGMGAWKESQLWHPLMQPTMMAVLLQSKSRNPWKVASLGQWQDEHTFMVRMQYLETPHSNTFIFHFDEDELRLQVTSSMKDPNSPFLSNVDREFAGALQPQPELNPS